MIEYSTIVAVQVKAELAASSSTNDPAYKAMHCQDSVEAWLASKSQAFLTGVRDAQLGCIGTNESGHLAYNPYVTSSQDWCEYNEGVHQHQARLARLRDRA